MQAQVKRMASAFAAGATTNAKLQNNEFQNKKTEQMFSFMVNTFKEATNKSSTTDQTNNKKLKANDYFAFDEDILDEI
jgi:hypothetical protein